MDCHLSSTEFGLLGFFKHRTYDDWFEQLFKHEGYCVWGAGGDDNIYKFMKDARKGWPQGCTASGQATSGGVPLYYDLKPKYSGEITIGMYSDEECTVEYSMSLSKIEAMVGNLIGEGGSGDHGHRELDNDGYGGDSLYSAVEAFNKYMATWSICHPCMAHDPSNYDGSKYYGACFDDGYYQNDDYNNNDDKAAYYNYNQKNNNNYWWNNGNRKLGQYGGEYCPKGYMFECYDDAGYTNVNQVRRNVDFSSLNFRSLTLTHSFFVTL